MSDTYSNAWLVAIVNDDTVVLDSDHIWVNQTTLLVLFFLPLGKRKVSQCSHVNNIMASKRRGQPASPSKYFKPSWIQKII